MVEELGNILGEGFKTWRQNLVICLPFVFSFILNFLVMVSIIIATALIVVIPSLSYSLPPPDGQTTQVLHQIMQHIQFVIAAVVIAIIVDLLINAFFRAGAIGMAREAIEGGSTRLSDMIWYGRRKYISLFFADILVGLIASPGLLFLVPGVLYLLPYVRMHASLSEMAPALVISGLGFMAMVIYLLIVSIMLILTPYAVVIDDLGAIAGVKRGFKAFMSQKMDVFLLWLIIIALSCIISFGMAFVPYIGWLISMIVSVAVLQPLAAVWWCRLYIGMNVQ